MRVTMTREFYVPTEYKEKIEVPGTTMVIYKISDTVAKGFSGKRAKPDFYYNFKTPETMKAYLDKYVEYYKDKEAYKEKKKAEKKAAIEKAATEVAPGDIYYTSGGYDQTDVHFYKVLGIKGKKVTLTSIGQEKTMQEMTYEEVIAVPDLEIGLPFTRMVGQYGFKINSFAYASKWDGKPKHQTAWGFGH